jgi:hypothetical protein
MPCLPAILGPEGDERRRYYWWMWVLIEIELKFCVDQFVTRSFDRYRLVTRQQDLVQLGLRFSKKAIKPSRPSRVLKTLHKVSIWFSTLRR